MTKEQELKNCTFIKTVLMILIVLYHSIVYFRGDWFPAVPLGSAVKPLAYLASWMNSFHIYAFVLVSGYLFHYLKFEARKYHHYGEFIRNKLKRLIVPYFFVMIVWVIPVYCLFYGWDRSVIVNKYLLGKSPNQLWFLLMLFLVFALFFPLSRWIRKHFIPGGILVLGLYAFGFLLEHFGYNHFQVSMALRMTLYFWIGFVIRQYDWGFLGKIPRILWLPAHIALFVVSNLIPQTNPVLKLIGLAFNVATTVVGAIMAFALLGLLAEKIRWEKSKGFGFLSRLSMPVYLFHQQVIYFVIYLLSRFPFTIHPYLQAVIHFVIALTVSILISVAFMLSSPTRFLIGEKKPLFAGKKADK